MWKFVAGLSALAFVLTAAFLAHGLMTGVGVPYPDPTPEQAAYVRYHLAVNEPLFLAAGLSWLATGAGGAAWAIRWVVGKVWRSQHIASSAGG